MRSRNSLKQTITSWEAQPRAWGHISGTSRSIWTARSRREGAPASSRRLPPHRWEEASFSEKAQWALSESEGPPRGARGPLNRSRIFYLNWGGFILNKTIHYFNGFHKFTLTIIKYNDRPSLQGQGSNISCFLCDQLCEMLRWWFLSLRCFLDMFLDAFGNVLLREKTTSSLGWYLNAFDLSELLFN